MPIIFFLNINMFKEARIWKFDPYPKVSKKSKLWCQGHFPISACQTHRWLQWPRPKAAQNSIGCLAMSPWLGDLFWWLAQPWTAGKTSPNFHYWVCKMDVPRNGNNDVWHRDVQVGIWMAETASMSAAVCWRWRGSDRVVVEVLEVWTSRVDSLERPLVPGQRRAFLSYLF